MRGVSKGNASGGGTIFLVGMMGAGKSTVGARLAARLGRPFLDTDRAVEAAAGRTIPEIFERDGEAVFRRLEREAIEEAAAAGAVVALGGGAMAQPGMPAWLESRGRVVWLRVDVETILSRVGDAEDRPLLADLDRSARRERLEALLAERVAAYGRAELEIDASGPPDRVAEEIAAALGVEASDSVRDGNG
jgi:shikimate kinase